MTRAYRLAREFTVTHSFMELIEGQASDYRPTLSGLGRDPHTRSEIAGLANLYALRWPRAAIRAAPGVGLIISHACAARSLP